MPLYICELCNYSSKIKTQLERHTDTKKHRVKSGNIPDEIIIYGGVYKKTPKDPKRPQKTPKNDVNIKHKTFFCEYCKSGFSTLAHQRRHEKNTCKKNYKQMLYDKDTEITDLKNEKKEIYKKIDKLLGKVGNTTHIQNTININNYGHEDLSHISKTMLDNLLTVPYHMIPKMIAEIHFNNEKPENKNILIPNKKDNFVKIFKNNKWVYQDKNIAIDRLVDEKYNVIDNHYELVDQQNEIGVNVKTNYLQFKKYYDDGDKEFIEKLKKECELILLNNR